MFMVDENTTTTSHDEQDEGSGSDVWVVGIIIMTIIGVVAGMTVLHASGAQYAEQQETCFNAVGDYKVTFIDSHPYCIVTDSTTKVSLYRLIEYDGRWVVSREATVLDGMAPGLYKQ